MPVKPPNIPNEDWEKSFKEWQARYHNVFATPQGKVVLMDMLQELNFFDSVKNEEDRIKSNYAKRLLYLCGGWTCNLTK